MNSLAGVVLILGSLWFYFKYELSLWIVIPLSILGIMLIAAPEVHS
jgi:hypothetical protein